MRGINRNNRAYWPPGSLPRWKQTEVSPQRVIWLSLNVNLNLFLTAPSCPAARLLMICLILFFPCDSPKILFVDTRGRLDVIAVSAAAGVFRLTAHLCKRFGDGQTGLRGSLLHYRAKQDQLRSHQLTDDFAEETRLECVVFYFFNETLAC